MTPPLATRANWRQPPFNRWAFRNFDALTPVETIDNDPADVAPLPRAAKPWAPNGLHRFLLDFTATDALVALVDGEVAFERYANGNGPQTRHIVMSCSKAIVGLLIGLLAEEKVLDYRAPVSTYLPEIADTRYAATTLRDLVDMRAGVELSPSERQAYQLATNWRPIPPGGGPASLRTALKSLAGAPSPGGQPFRYRSANTDLLGWAIERATGKTIAKLISERLWRPMGAESPAYVSTDDEGLARSAGGVCATARDVARLGQAMIAGGRRGKRQIIPAAAIDDIRANGDRAAWARGEWRRLMSPARRDMSYRSGWYVANDAPRCVFAIGIHGQNLFLDFERRIVVAKLSSWKKADGRLPFLATHWAFARLQKALG